VAYAYPIEQRITRLGREGIKKLSYRPEEEKDLEEEDYDC